MLTLTSMEPLVSILYFLTNILLVSILQYIANLAALISMLPVRKAITASQHNQHTVALT